MCPILTCLVSSVLLMECVLGRNSLAQSIPLQVYNWLEVPVV